jgi:hypothetical protein
MTLFDSDAWRTASASGSGLKPEPGLYDAEVIAGKLRHRNDNGQPLIVITYRGLTGVAADMEWDELTSVQENTAGLVKGILSGIGRDPDVVTSEDTLADELAAAVGCTVTVQVKQRGEYRNTMPLGVAVNVVETPVDSVWEAEPAQTYGQPPAPARDTAGDDEPLPF